MLILWVLVGRTLLILQGFSTTAWVLRLCCVATLGLGIYLSDLSEQLVGVFRWFQNRGLFVILSRVNILIFAELLLQFLNAADLLLLVGEFRALSTVIQVLITLIIDGLSIGLRDLDQLTVVVIFPTLLWDWWPTAFATHSVVILVDFLQDFWILIVLARSLALTAIACYVLVAEAGAHVSVRPTFALAFAFFQEASLAALDGWHWFRLGVDRVEWSTTILLWHLSRRRLLIIIRLLASTPTRLTYWFLATI